VIDPARACVEGWKQWVRDRSLSGRLLDVADDPSYLPVPGVEPLALVQALAAGRAFTLESGEEPALDRGVLRVPLAAPELARRLVRMRRRARAELADAGLHVLWLAVGVLAWCDADDVAHRAPLALWPVALARGADGSSTVVAAPGPAPTVNHALVEKLRRDVGVDLAPGQHDTGGELALAELPALLATAEELARTRPGWRLDRSAAIGVFSLDGIALWRDLERLGEAVVDSPVVAQLAAPSGPFAQASIAAAEAVTRPRASADLLAPLDADASQLAAVAAAAAGASFVLRAPPGTGASQTIANLIAHCISDGKSVLFVSPRRAALEVVHDRLTAVGLGEFCLSLVSAERPPTAVLDQLGRVLERAFRPGTAPSGGDARLAELRAALDAHVAALHEVGPFGRSLHEVIGRLVELRTTPRAALADPDAHALDGATFERRLAAVTRLAAAAAEVEPAATHPWRAATIERWLPEHRERALAALDETAAAVRVLDAAVREVTALVPGVVARSREQLEALGTLATLAATSPRPGAELLTQLRASRTDEVAERVALVRARGGGSIEVPRDPMTYLALATKHRALVVEIEGRFTDGIAELDAPAMWMQLRKWTRRVAPVRFMALRAARAAVRAAARPGQLATDEEMIAALEAVIAERACRAALLAAAGPARRWFGELARSGLATDAELRAIDLDAIEAAVGWAGELRKAFDAIEVAGGESARASAWRALVAQVAASPTADATSTSASTPVASATARPAESLEGSPFVQLADAVTRWRSALADVSDLVGIPAASLAAGDDPLPELAGQVATLRASIDALRPWVAFHAARRGALADGVGPAVAAIDRGDLGAEELARAWERATLLAWAEEKLSRTPALASDRMLGHGAAYHAQVSAFADLDRGALALARARALVRIAERVPRGVKPHDPRAAEPDGEVGVLLAELARRGARPVREVLAQLPTILTRLAPCVIATPVAVAELLDPALPKFDLVVLDDSSQLPTAHAIGALARGASAVVVGDRAQLPPPVAALDEPAPASVEVESVLDACLAAQLPELQLGWQYRARHEDLIAFANQRYYDDRLQVLPVAQVSTDLGVAWRRVEAGASGEAEAIVAEVLSRLADPAQRLRSLGVITLCRAQQERIEDLLDEARRRDPSLDALFEPPPGAVAPFEPPWVKHVDAVGGHARDVVLLSVGGALDAAGAALSEPGGARRIAAAITRAREQLIAFSSFAPEDVPEEASPALRDLAAFLAFARAGGNAARAADDAPPATPITDAIARALGERGWTVRHQVGCGAYRIDLAVVDPADPRRFVLAIEHDGPAYASAAVARDRDRLRPQLLAQLGWRVHTIASLDWWTDPEREIQRAHGAIVAAVAASRQRRSTTTPPRPRAARTRPELAAGSSPVVRIPPKRTRPPVVAPAPVAVADTGALLAAGSGPNEATPLAALDGTTTSTRLRLARGAIAIGPYLAAAIPNGRRKPDDLFAPRHVAELGKVIEQVLAAEAPMHIGLLARRVGGYFGIGKVTERVTEQVRAALEGRGAWGDEQDIVWRLDQDPSSVPPVRVAGHGPAARRDIAEVPLAELAAAARIVVERASGIPAPDLVRDAARLLGFARITDHVTARVTRGVQLAIARDLIRLVEGRVVVPD